MSRVETDFSIEENSWNCLKNMVLVKVRINQTYRCTVLVIFNSNDRIRSFSFFKILLQSKVMTVWRFESSWPTKVEFLVYYEVRVIWWHHGYRSNRNFTTNKTFFFFFTDSSVSIILATNLTYERRIWARNKYFFSNFAQKYEVRK